MGGMPWRVAVASVSAGPRYGILRLGEPADLLERQRLPLKRPRRRWLMIMAYRRPSCSRQIRTVLWPVSRRYWSRYAQEQAESQR